MGDKVNTAHWDAYASVTPDGKYLMFNRSLDEDGNNIDIYWIDAQIIETLRLKQQSSNKQK
jgi:Tol biopolymer transport system component